MSEQKTRVLKTPILLNKGILNVNPKIKVLMTPIPKETIIFDSENVDFLQENFKKVTLINKQNLSNNFNSIIAKITTKNGEIIEKNSDATVKLLGQEKFEILYMALCSVINQELRIRGILSLLKEKNSKNFVEKIPKSNKEVQTNEISHKRTKNVQRPYVMKEFNLSPKKIRKVIIDPYNLKHTEITETRENQIDLKKNFELPELIISDLPFDNCDASTIRSFQTTTTILERPLSVFDRKNSHFKSEENEINIKYFKMVTLDSKEIILPYKNIFHIATRENLEKLDLNNQNLLKKHEIIMNLKHCLTPIDENYLPIHIAVLEDDVHLLRMQCAALNTINKSLDITANGLTPLKLSLFQETTNSTSILLQNGADPLLGDDDHLTSIHAAAELNTDHLSILIAHCRENARSIISNNEDYMFNGWNEMSNNELSTYLLDKFCSTFDKKGRTPLMLASMLGVHENVRLLLDTSPSSVNIQMPTGGNTALYIAVTAASNAFEESCNVNKVMDKFRMTIETLLEHGADPEIENFSGTSTSALLSEINHKDLKTLVGNKLMQMNFFENQPLNKDFDKFILVKDVTGNINIEEVEMKEVSFKKDVILTTETSYLTGVKDELSNMTGVKDELSSETSNVTDVKDMSSDRLMINVTGVKDELASDLMSNVTVMKENSDFKCESKPVIVDNIVLPANYINLNTKHVSTKALKRLVVNSPKIIAKNKNAAVIKNIPITIRKNSNKPIILNSKIFRNKIE